MKLNIIMALEIKLLPLGFNLGQGQIVEGWLPCEEVLDDYLFDDLKEIRAVTNSWLDDYNTIRLHEALQGLPPRQFAQQHAKICLLTSATNLGRLTRAHHTQSIYYSLW